MEMKLEEATPHDPPPISIQQTPTHTQPPTSLCARTHTHSLQLAASRPCSVPSRSPLECGDQSDSWGGYSQTAPTEQTLHWEDFPLLNHWKNSQKCNSLTKTDQSGKKLTNWMLATNQNMLASYHINSSLNKRSSLFKPVQNNCQRWSTTLAVRNETKLWAKLRKRCRKPTTQLSDSH